MLMLTTPSLRAMLIRPTTLIHERFHKERNREYALSG